MNTELLGIIFLPVGVICMSLGGLWQMYIMLTESYTLNRFKDKQLVWVVTILFFTLSLAVYYFCPNARKKGIIFFILSVGGVVMYFLAKHWLPFKS